MLCQRAVTNRIQIKLLTIFGIEHALNAVQIVGVFSAPLRPSLVYPAPDFDVFGIGDRSQFLFRTIFQNPGCVVHTAGRERLITAEQAGQEESELLL